ncbi:ABC transporter ATP-binding protein [Aneurinibacillus aneurinilyticus]|jgi:ATP-binding cassette subfamily B protein|uniref:ABC transporter ATP-binding protein n=2 Tax=Aneurinibacillus aneurinilyticus TaxID=1391 RepID=A0A848D6N1_ANEAE|nr:ABC transporter ATP-binding protein [Aneurinibacillus aneurinilyticus]ERI11749.1 ABC transporter, ATP-binding protein [Aneurinibacillus aneurinilyticus ATCC 12856]MCI1696795.1 ABC transporter ATP-binding protein/permease [Aneurinibacillus aneurinilyticus]MED0705657.1 ABC transporter ATP-binding protein [Aneurinibacillus aneurinilyticus]MED0724239.1 ABC transporter ATP-binding protein [Aneurinibacillus aneurinilyticus]MED0734750.1 ABC transporter ATP-binding protein [Aneurinibacillus aneurin
MQQLTGGGGPKGRISGPAAKAKNPKETLLRVWNYMEKQKAALLLSTLFVILSSLLSLSGPYYIGVIIDHYIIPKDVPGTIRMAGMLLGIYLAASLFTWLQTYMMVNVSLKTIGTLREDLFIKLQTLSLNFFDRHKHGDLMSRFTNDIDNLNQALSQSVIQIISSILTVAGVAIAMFSLNWVLAIVSFITVPLMLFVTRQIVRISRENFSKRQKDLGELNGFIEESISGGEVITLFGKEHDTFTEFHTVNERLRQSAMRADIFSGLLGPSNNFLSNLGLGLVIGIGTIMALKGLITVGIIASFVTYSRQFSRPINQISTLLNSIQAALAGAERVFEMMDEVPDLKDKNDAISVSRFQGNIKFTNVSFSYNNERKVLQHINFEAKAGEMIALVGPTGSGKTTIINLLMRFYDINSGEILIDGRKSKDYKIRDLRKRIGIVLQDPYLFSGTVMENIRYGRLDATDEEVIQAAKTASAHGFIKHLPDQYNTMIASGGANISQGQKQLLSIARAILADADILILDEATSNIDTRTEVEIQKGIRNLTEGKTSFVIAHRLKTIEQANRILVIKDGELLEQGNHDELLDQRGFYHGLYSNQLRI